LETVLTSNFPGAKELPRSFQSLWIPGEGHDRAAHKHWRLGFEEILILRAGVAPVLFGYAKVLQHPLRSQKPRCYRDCGDTILPEFGSPDGGQGLLRELHDLRNHVSTG